jgi:hypothetical protein
MPDALTGQAAVGVAARCRARRANSPLSIPSPALLRPRQTAFWRNHSQTTAGRVYGSPSSNTSPLDRSSTRAPAAAPRAWARAAEVGPRQVAPRGASSRTTASWRTSGRRCTARCSEPTAAGVRVIGGVTTSASRGSTATVVRSARKRKVVDPTAPLTLSGCLTRCQPEPLVTQDFGPGNGSRRPQDAGARCRPPRPDHGPDGVQ